MSAFRGILTGFGMAAIKDKEAKDNAKMEVVKAAGIDYHTNQLPAHKKSEASRAKEYSMVSKLLNSEEAADYFEANGFITGDGKGVERVQSYLENNSIKADAFKDYVPTENYSDRYKQRQTDFESRFDIVKKTFDMQGSGIGPSTINGLLTKPEGDITTTIKGEPGSQMGPVITEGTPDREETINRSTSSLPISSFYGAKPDTVGVETKYNSISKAVNEQMGYGEPIYRADGSVTFNIANDLKTTSNAHIALASSITQQRDDINQLDAVSLADQELFKQTVTPFNIIASSIKGANYSAGSGKKPALIEGMGGQTIDAETTMIGDQSVYDFVAEIYNNDLLKDNDNVNRHVFKKFIENLPMNITYKGEKLSDVIANAHELQYFKQY